jgi:hypothetical protein
MKVASRSSSCRDKVLERRISWLFRIQKKYFPCMATDSHAQDLNIDPSYAEEANLEEPLITNSQRRISASASSEATQGPRLSYPDEAEAFGFLLNESPEDVTSSGPPIRDGYVKFSVSELPTLTLAREDSIPPLKKIDSQNSLKNDDYPLFITLGSALDSRVSKVVTSSTIDDQPAPTESARTSSSALLNSDAEHLFLDSATQLHQASPSSSAFLSHVAEDSPTDALHQTMPAMPPGAWPLLIFLRPYAIKMKRQKRLPLNILY